MKTKFYSSIILIPILIGMVSLKTYADRWVQKANFGGTARYAAASFAIGTKGYIGTGRYNDSIPHYLNDFWEYDQGGNTWAQKANFGGTARYAATGFSIGTMGYIGTGNDGNFYSLKDFWEYNPVTNIWTQKADFGGTARYAATGFSMGTMGYIGTGDADIIGWSNDFWKYEQSSDTWTQKANFGGVGRYAAVGFSIGSKGYIGTGVDSSFNYKNDFWEYDQGNNTWTQKANFGGGIRYGATGFSIGAKGYIGTGVDTSIGYRNDFWEYDPGNNTWNQKANFGGVAKYLGTGLAIGAKGYIGTGLYYGSWSQSLNDFWEYTPDSTNGIEELNISNAINIYPNPLTSSSILQLSTQLKNAEVVIYDMVGKEMLRKKLSGDRMEIERGLLESGVYFVKVVSEEGQWVEKVVVE